MPGINIPGVTDKYNTNNTVEKLMQIERIPLTREQKTLESYKNQQEAWREVNRRMSSLRDSVKTLYSFENPFNNKITSSTEEYAITADANRGAAYESFKVDVIQPATADRFLSAELDSDYKVPSGTYTYKIADKTITMRWKGGSLQDFSSALNRRGTDFIQSRVIGASKGKKTLSIESLKTGEENRLSFEDDAKTFAESSGMIIKVKPKTVTFASDRNEFKQLTTMTTEEQKHMPAISAKNISVNNREIKIPPRSGFEVGLPSSVKDNPKMHLFFTLKKEDVQDITEELNKKAAKPELPYAGEASFRDVTIHNSPADPMLPSDAEVKREPLKSIVTNDVIFAKYEDGSEKVIPAKDLLSKSQTDFDIDLSDYRGIKSIVVRNRNTGHGFLMSDINAFDPGENLGFTAQNAISTAKDAIIKYEGITIKRPTNKIDDVVPEVTLNIHEKTEKTATIEIKPDTEAAKDALITFVGKYNQAISEINILSQSKPEIIEELDYLSKDEKEEEKKRLGLFLSDSSLTSLKSSLQSSVSAKYSYSEDAVITMLSQLGIATNSSSYSGYTPSKLRGYLEIDEKKLDSTLSENLEDVKNLFGFDSDGDLIIDSGIALNIDKKLTAYVQSGGIFALKTSSLDSRIKSSEQKISKLESQMDKKEAELRNKYGQMEGTLNSLENQSNSISNFTNRNNNR